MAASVWPYGQQPTRLLCPRDSLGKNTGVGCHLLLLNLGQQSPKLFGTQGSVWWKTSFTWTKGDLGMIQAHDINCAHYCYYYDISFSSDHHTLDPGGWGPLIEGICRWDMGTQQKVLLCEQTVGEKMDPLSSFLEAKAPILIARQQIGTSSEEGSVVPMEASPLGSPGGLPGACWPGLSPAGHSTALSGPCLMGRVLR